MKLVDKVVEKRLEAFPLFSQEGLGLDAKVLVRYTMESTGISWFVYEGSREGEDDWFFNVCVAGRDIGYTFDTVALSTLSKLYDVYGNKVVRDVKFKPTALRKCIKDVCGGTV